MTITKEQFELFNNNFKVVEITNNVSEYQAMFNYDDIIKQEDSPGESFLDVNWELKYSEPFESGCYSIISKDPETHITFVSGLEDIQNFIKNEMDSYLKVKGI